MGLCWQSNVSAFKYAVWEKEIATHSSIPAGEFHGQRSLAGYSPWDRKELDTTEVKPASSHEIKRCLLLGRKVMTNLDSVLKSRNITLPTKIHQIKPMVFPVVMDVSIEL